MSAPAWVTYFVVGGNIATIVTLLAIIRAAAARSDWPQAKQKRVSAIAGLVLGGWLVAAIALALGGAYGANNFRLPTIQYGLLVPIVAGLPAWALSPTVRRLVAMASQAWVVGIQVYRLEGAIFLILLAAGQLPAAFALPAGIGDVIVGLAAPFVALAYARRPRENRALVAAWNIFGLADLFVAVTTGMLTSPSPLQHLAFDHPNVIITLYPLVLIPTFLVPIAILLHIASLVKLVRNEGARADVASA